MKVFWSWQSDTPGRIGRHFVRDTLAEAIKTLKQAEEVEEPSERETREALHLDQDRQGVPGSPDLAPTIFKKIDRAAVFIADVTLVAQMAVSAGGAATPAKKLINSNVAIEYGYALRSLGDEHVLTVQNRHYGERDELPFDLKHKAGPIQYSLPPEATRQQIKEEGAKLRGIFIDALTPYLKQTADRRTADAESRARAARGYFVPDLARIVARQIQILDRTIPNFIMTSVDKPPPGDRWISLKPAQPVLNPNAAPEFANLPATDATLLIEFYSSVQEIADIVNNFVDSEPPPPRVNAWNFLMQKVARSLEIGHAAVQRFCPERQYDPTMPAVGTLTNRIEVAISHVKPAPDAHLVRRAAAAAATAPSSARGRARRSPPIQPRGPHSWMAK